MKSANPADPPAMIPNYLSDPVDQQTIVDGLKLCRQILAHPSLQQYVAEEFQPGPASRPTPSCSNYARQRGGTVYHPTSTCTMGTGPMAVVDPALRVHGIEGLRVADASVMPTVISGNTNAATIMIGEKLADMVRGRMRMAA